MCSIRCPVSLFERYRSIKRYIADKIFDWDVLFPTIFEFTVRTSIFGWKFGTAQFIASSLLVFVYLFTLTLNAVITCVSVKQFLNYTGHFAYGTVFIFSVIQYRKREQAALLWSVCDKDMADSDKMDADLLSLYRSLRSLWNRILRRTFCKIVCFYGCLICFNYFSSLSAVYWFALGNPDNKKIYFKYLPFPIWSPFEVDTFERYFIAFTIQYVLRLPLINASLPVAILYYYFANLVRHEVNTLVKIVSMIDSLVDVRMGHLKSVGITRFGGRQWRCPPVVSSDDEWNNTVRDRIYRRLLLQCLRCHQRFIVKFVKDLIAVYERLLISLFAIADLVITVNCYLCIVEGWSFSRNFERILFILSSTLTLFYMCHLATYFSEMNEKFSDALYMETNWQDKSVATRKLLLSMMSVLKWELRLSLTPLNFLSHSFCGRSMKSIYDGVSFLVSVYK